MNLVKLLGEDGLIALASLAICGGLCSTGAATNQPSALVYTPSKSPVSQSHSIVKPTGESYHPEPSAPDFKDTEVAEPTKTLFYRLRTRREGFEK